MRCTQHTLSALLAVGLCILVKAQLGESQYVPARCMCLKPKTRVQGPFLDFKITLSAAGCGRDEIIVILKKNKQPVCLSPLGPQGQRLLKCYHRKLEEGKDGKTCKGRLRQRASKQRVKSKKAKS